MQEVASTNELLEFKGIEIAVSGLRHFECSQCHTYCETPEQLDANAEIMHKAWSDVRVHDKQQKGLLTGKEIRAIREYLGITQKQASLMFGGGSNAFAKYEAEDVFQSEAMNKLLLLAKEMPAVAQHLAEKVGVTLKAQTEQAIKKDRVRSFPFSENPQVKVGRFNNRPDVCSNEHSMEYANAA